MKPLAYFSLVCVCDQEWNYFKVIHHKSQQKKFSNGIILFINIIIKKNTNKDRKKENMENYALFKLK